MQQLQQQQLQLQQQQVQLQQQVPQISGQEFTAGNSRRVYQAIDAVRHQKHSHGRIAKI